MYFCDWIWGFGIWNINLNLYVKPTKLSSEFIIEYIVFKLYTALKNEVVENKFMLSTCYVQFMRFFCAFGMQIYFVGNVDLF